jgi:hypothetical protein
MGIFELWDMAMEDSRNKLEQQRMANTLMQRQMDAQSRLIDLSGETREQYVPPLGLLNVEGAPPEAQLGSVGDFTRTVPALHHPYVHNEVVGVAAGRAPATTAQQLLGGKTGGRATELLSIGRMLGLQGKELVDFIRGGGQGVDPTQAYLSTLLGMQREADLTDKAEERRIAREERRAEFTGKRNMVTGSVGTLRDMYGAMKRMAPYNVFGNPMVSELGAQFMSMAPEQALGMASRLGMGQEIGPEDLALLRSGMADFGRYANNVVLNTAGSSQNIRGTNANMSIIQDSKPNMDSPAQSNFNGMKHLMEQELLNNDTLPEDFRMADADRQWLESTIEEINDRQQAIMDAIEFVNRYRGDEVRMQQLRQMLMEDGISPAEVGL